MLPQVFRSLADRIGSYFEPDVAEAAGTNIISEGTWSYSGPNDKYGSTGQGELYGYKTPSGNIYTLLNNDPMHPISAAYAKDFFNRTEYRQIPRDGSLGSNIRLNEYSAKIGKEVRDDIREDMRRRGLPYAKADYLTVGEITPELLRMQPKLLEI